MKKPYEKPAVIRRDSLAAVTQIPASKKAAPSDARLKTDITAVGMAANGLNLYTWRYHGQPEVWQGVMAQEVLRSHPDAVETGAHGFYTVNYDKLGVEMIRVH